MSSIVLSLIVDAGPCSGRTRNTNVTIILACMIEVYMFVRPSFDIALILVVP